MSSQSTLTRTKRSAKPSDKVRQTAEDVAQKQEQRRQQDTIRDQQRKIREAKKAQKAAAMNQGSQGPMLSHHNTQRNMPRSVPADELSVRSEASQPTLAARHSVVPPPPTHTTTRRLTPDQVRQLVHERFHSEDDDDDDDYSSLPKYLSRKRPQHVLGTEDNSDDGDGGSAHKRQCSAPVDVAADNEPIWLEDADANIDEDDTQPLNEVITSASGKTTSCRQRLQGRAQPDEVQDVLWAAISIFGSLMCLDHAFPNSLQEHQWAERAWKKACEFYNVEHVLTPAVRKLITDRTSHLRGELKTKARPLVETTFGFEVSDDADVQAANRKLVEDLKRDTAFVYRVRGETAEEHRGMFLAKIIQQLINAVFYKGKKAMAVRWEEFFETFPGPGFALVLSAIECSIDEWSTGSFEKVAFSEANYRDVFETHLKNLDDFAGHGNGADRVLEKFMQRVHRIGSSHARVAAPSRAPQPMKPAAFDTAVFDMIRDLD
ncbi:hypothetical protein CONPUDRAFT_86174 [Coniophora puteana RWD-64-598 SS2]|uniref:DUF6532 domain-containing protein n=1 Tax=Coniophora puteana (strain RWD-64-598) TaxID=741705 RepID=A0A5M3N4Y7_CONPW|nr:uncharacterized protein CONPUDRAFT_86174 [Coniophora puteana RWD-64-598 SS2]EIW85981.1 hypothetical protein CONPUDRAFT_86174 [Coniophora puteana RWD-64-598 SS2]